MLVLAQRFVEIRVTSLKGITSDMLRLVNVSSSIGVAVDAMLDP